MSAIETIIATYIRFQDEEALLSLKAHRQKLLTTMDENDAFFQNLRSQCLAEISAIDAGLVRMRPPVALVQDCGEPELLDAEPVAIGSEEDAGVAQAADIAGPEQQEAAAAPLPEPDPPELNAPTARRSQPELISGSLLAATFASRAKTNGTRLAMDLVELQLQLTTDLKN